MRNRSLSTGDMARFCQVTPATIVNWIRAGKLEVYTTPGGQYRMERAKFIEFLQESGFPIPEDLQESGVRRVLVIDDDPDILDMLKEVLEEHDPSLEVDGATNGYDALLKVGKTKPDVISLDLMMPKMDGAEMLRRLRGNAETKNIRVVVVTALHSNTDLVRRAKRIGVDGFITKPVDLTHFTELIRSLAARGAIR